MNECKDCGTKIGEGFTRCYKCYKKAQDKGFDEKDPYTYKPVRQGFNLR